MDWLFIPLGKAIKSSFQFLELAGMNFNWTMILVGTALGVYWIKELLSEKNDKGYYIKKD
jgi:hypothetical protein